jgi:hypothetical protein
MTLQDLDEQAARSAASRFTYDVFVVHADAATDKQRSGAGWVLREINSQAGWIVRQPVVGMAPPLIVIRRSTDDRRAQTRPPAARVRSLPNARSARATAPGNPRPSSDAQARFKARTPEPDRARR